MKSVLRKIAPIASLAGLAVILSFSICVFRGKCEFATYLLWTSIATVVWFLFSPFWLISDKRSET